MANRQRDAVSFDLVPDKKGVVWDLMLYIPTVVALASISISLWYGNDQNTAYLFFFLTSFFFIAGFNRIFTRLLLFPSSPVRLELGENSLSMQQKNNTNIALIKNQKFYSDYAGKSFAVSGLDGQGKQLQFVFHKGQFASSDEFDSALSKFKERFKP